MRDHQAIDGFLVHISRGTVEIQYETIPACRGTLYTLVHAGYSNIVPAGIAFRMSRS